MSGTRPRLAVIGLGWAARELHLPALRRTGAFEVVGTADPSPGLKADYLDYREMLERVECDAVLIATPPALHREGAEAALAAGRHVMLEKPVAAGVEDARAIGRAAEAAGRVCAVGLNQRCHPRFVDLRNRIRRGDLGRVEKIRSVWTTGSGYSARSWLGRREEGGGSLLDLGSHQLDLWRFLLGEEPEEVKAESESHMLDDESGRLDARFGGGAVCEARLSLVGGDTFTVEVEGTKGRVRVKPYGRGMQASYDEQWRRFARAVMEGGAPAADVRDGIAGLEWLVGAVQGLPKAARRERVAVEYPLTVISSTTRDYGALRTTVEHLSRQTVAGRMELVLVGPEEETLKPPEEVAEAFAAVQRVGVGPVRSIAHANAAGVRRARGRVVVLTEDHCFPDPDWAEALLKAHEEEWIVVGPVVRNANPGTLVSWADFVIGYGPWMEPSPRHSPPFLPGHNSSYKREWLLELGGRLEPMLEAETVLHYEWTARGVPMCVEPGARVRHVNYSKWRSWIPVQFWCGRLFGGLRSVSWSRKKQLFYVAASPLIPAVRFWRSAREFFKPGRSRGLFLRLAPALALGLVVDGAGQMVGYLLGAGRSMEELAKYEFNRIEHVREEDRGLWISA